LYLLLPVPVDPWRAAGDLSMSLDLLLNNLWPSPPSLSIRRVREDRQEQNENRTTASRAGSLLGRRARASPRDGDNRLI